MVLQTGVYAIVNTVNGKQYRGSAAVSFTRRWLVHRSTLNRGKHCNKHLQSAWNLYGASKFRFLVLERTSPEDCVAREQVWIDSAKGEGVILYNLSPTAGSVAGMKRPRSVKKRIRATVNAMLAAGSFPVRRGWKHSADALRRISEAGRKRGPRSKKTIAKIRAAKWRELVGNTYGDLTVVKELRRCHRGRRVLCECSCGNQVTRVLVDVEGSVKSGRRPGCGCYKSSAQMNAKKSVGLRRSWAHRPQDSKDRASKKIAASMKVVWGKRSKHQRAEIGRSISNGRKRRTQC